MKAQIPLPVALLYTMALLVLSQAIADAQTNCLTPPVGLVSWWRAEVNGNDSVGTNTGTLLGGLTFANGKVGQAFSFDGVDDFATIPASSTLDVGAGDSMTIEGWINPTDVNSTHALWEWNDGVGNFGVHVWFSIPDYGGVRSIFANLPDAANNLHYLASPPGLLTAGSFQHIALTYTKSNGIAKIYYNGSVVANQNLGVFTPQTFQKLYLGMRPAGPSAGSFFNGVMDEVSLYNRALTDSEILAIYNAGNAGKCQATAPTNCAPIASGLVSWWRAESNGNDSVGTNTGTLMGGLPFVNGEVGQAFNFDGTNDFVSIPASGTLDVGAGDSMTIEGWINPTDVNSTHALWEWNDGVGNFGVHVWFSIPDYGGARSIFADLPDAANNLHYLASPPGLLTAGSFQHIALTYTKSNGIAKIYYNGSVVANQNLGVFTPQTFQKLYLGMRPAGPSAGSFFNGVMDEVSLYNRALTDSEILAIYNAGNGGKCQVTAPTNCAPAASGLVSWWRAEGNSADSIGSLNGSLYGGTTFATGKVGQAFSFNGISSYVQIEDSASLTLTNELTIEFWVKLQRTDGQADYIIEKGGDITGGVQNYAVAIHQSSLVFLCGGSGRYAGQITDLNWHHCAVVASNHQADPTFYIDGVQQSIVFREGGPTMNLYPSTQPVHIGAQVDPLTGWNYFSKTLIDELAIYNRSLSAGEIQAIYNAGTAGKCQTTSSTTCVSALPGLVNWWGAEGSAEDSLGNLNGALYGGTTFAPGKVGQAFSFDGINDSITNTMFGLTNILDSYTMEFWAWPTAGRASTPESTSGVAGHGNQRYAIFPYPGPTGGTVGAGISVGTNGVSVFEAGNAYLPSLLVFDAPIIGWTHIAVVYTNRRPNLYLNGILVRSGLTSPNQSCPSTWLGERGPASANQGYYAGLLDEVSIYNRPLLANEIQAIYNAGNISRCVLPPAITMDPTNQIVMAGSNVILVANASGSRPLSYQWTRNGTNLVGATNTMLNLSHVTDLDAGLYRLAAQNPAGSVTSAPALLDVRYSFAYGNGQWLVSNQYTFVASVDLQFLSAFPNGSLFYTLDGSQPSFTSSYYTSPFTLKRSAQLRVIAYRADFLQAVESPAIQLTVVPTYPLTLTSSGGGTVLVNPAAGAYLSNTVVTLTPQPANGWTFIEWRGDAVGANPALDVIMNRAKSINAVFGTTLGTTVAGSGAVSVYPALPVYPYGTVVRLTAIPATGNYFALWGNAASGNTNPLTLTITNPATTISSLFSASGANQHALSVMADGLGKVTISPKANVYATGANVSLSATPETGQQFLGWSGDATGTLNPLAIKMDADKHITATFSRRAALAVSPLAEALFQEGFRLSLQGEFGQAYRIDVSTNLVDWLPLKTITNIYGTTQFQDESATNADRRFYQSVVVP